MGVILHALVSGAKCFAYLVCVLSIVVCAAVFILGVTGAVFLATTDATSFDPWMHAAVTLGSLLLGIVFAALQAVLWEHA